MSIVRRTRADINQAKLLVELTARRQPSEEEIAAQAAEDGDAWTDDDLADAELVYPPPSAEELRALRAKLGLTQKQLARRFGVALESVQQYEQGRRRPSGSEATLFRVIAAEPDAVLRALRLRTTGRRPADAARIVAANPGVAATTTARGTQAIGPPLAKAVGAATARD